MGAAQSDPIVLSELVWRATAGKGARSGMNGGRRIHERWRVLLRIQRIAPQMLRRWKDRVLAGASRAISNEIERRNAERGQGSWRWFTNQEAAVAEALANIIVPSDQETPGMDDVDVLGPAGVVVLDKLIAACSERQLAYSRGLLAFDLWAVNEYGKRFTELPQKERTLLFSDAVRIYQNWRAVSGPIGKGWSIFKIMLPGRGVPFVAGLLYPHVRSDCFQVFYTSRVSWIWLEYDGPPMEKGYLKLDVSRNLE